MNEHVGVDEIMYEDLGEVGAHFPEMSVEEQDKFLDWAFERMLAGECMDEHLFGVTRILHYNLEGEDRWNKIFLRFVEVHEKGFRYYSHADGDTLEEHIKFMTERYFEEHPTVENDPSYQKIKDEGEVLLQKAREAEEVCLLLQKERHEKAKDMMCVMTDVVKNHIRSGRGND